MFIPDKYVQILSKPVAEGGLGYKTSSITTLNYNLRKLFFDAFVPTGKYKGFAATPEGRKDFYKRGKLIVPMLNHTEAIMGAIMTQPEKQRLQYLYVLKVIYDNWEGKDAAIAKYFQSEYDKLKDQRTEVMTMAGPTEKEMENTLTDSQYDDVLQKYNEKATEPSATPAILLRRLILALYKYIPPLRPQDYVNTAFKGEAEAANHIDLAKNVLVITEGKRTNAENARRIPLPDELVSIIRETKAKLGSKWLIPMATDPNRPMERTAFTHFLQKTFKMENLPANIGATRLRNMKVSKEVDEGASAAEIKETAKTMGHSVGTALTVYSKNSEKLHGKKAATTDDKDAIIAKQAEEIAKLRDLLETQNKLIKMLVAKFEA